MRGRAGLAPVPHAPWEADHDGWCRSPGAAGLGVPAGAGRQIEVMVGVVKAADRNEVRAFEAAPPRGSPPSPVRERPAAAISPGGDGCRELCVVATEDGCSRRSIPLHRREPPHQQPVPATVRCGRRHAPGKAAPRGVMVSRVELSEERTGNKANRRSKARRQAVTVRWAGPAGASDVQREDLG